MTSISAIQGAIKAKAPIVAIPVEGHAPVCVRGGVLRGWAKGMVIERVVVDVNPPKVTFRLPKMEWSDEVHGYVQPEGPEERVETPRPRTLRLEGRPVKSPWVRSRCSMVAIERWEAIRELAKWSEKERERQGKKRMLGALGLTAADRKAMKRAMFEEEGEGMVEVMCAMWENPDHRLRTHWNNDIRHFVGKCSCGWSSSSDDYLKEHILHAPAYRKMKMGIPVTLGELAEFQFAAVRWGDGENEEVSFTVTEMVTGRQCGMGKTAEAAILDAKVKIGKMSPEQLEDRKREIREERDRGRVGEPDREVVEV